MMRIRRTRRPFAACAAAWFAASRACYAAVAVAARYGGAAEYDASSNLLFLARSSRNSEGDAAAFSTAPRGAAEVLPRALLHWDAVHFYSVWMHGLAYPAETQLPFFPLYPAVVGLIASGVSALFAETTVLPHPAAVWALAGIAITGFCVVVAACLLYRLILKLTSSAAALARERPAPPSSRPKPHASEFLADPDRRDTMARLGVLLFFVQPGSIFLCTMYSEAMYCALAFGGMLLFENRKWALAALCWAACSGVRSNAIINVFFFAHRFLFHERYLRFFLYSAICVLPLILIQGIHYYNFCKSSSAGADGSTTGLSGETLRQRPRPWCSEVPPLSYPFVQRHYWGVGFLHYFRAEDVGMIVIAIPMVWRSFLTAYRLFRVVRSDMGHPLVPYIAIQLFFTAYIFLVAQQSISVRVFSCLPLLFIAQYPDSVCDRGWLIYSVIYSCIGAALFANHSGGT